MYAMIISSGDRSSVFTCFAKAPLKNVRALAFTDGFLSRFLFVWWTREKCYCSTTSKSKLTFPIPSTSVSFLYNRDSTSMDFIFNKGHQLILTHHDGFKSRGWTLRVIVTVGRIAQFQEVCRMMLTHRLAASRSYVQI